MTVETLAIDATTSARLMRRAARAVLVIQSVMMALKLGAWVVTDSVSMLSALIDSVLDVVAAFVNLMAMRQALAPADREHRFGHGKIEPLASLGQAAFIAGSSVVLMIEVAHHIVQPVEVTDTGLGLIVMAVAIVASFGLLRYEQAIVRKTGSLLLSGDALHNAGDLALNGGVVLALIFTKFFGWSLIDPIFGGAIALWILFSAYQVAQKSIVQLMDRELSDEARARIRKLALAHAEVRAVHDLKTREAGPTAFIQLHLEMDGGMTLRESHRVADAVEADILEQFPRAEIIIHQDPEGVDEKRLVFPATG
jgi:ferrous-iron efflux pump FieF